MKRPEARCTPLRNGMLIAALLTLLAPPTASSSQFDLESLQDQAVQWPQHYILIHPTNPPANEIAAAASFPRSYCRWRAACNAVATPPWCFNTQALTASPSSKS